MGIFPMLNTQEQRYCFKSFSWSLRSAIGKRKKCYRCSLSLNRSAIKNIWIFYTHISETSARILQSGLPKIQGYCCQYTCRSLGKPGKKIGICFTSLYALYSLISGCQMSTDQWRQAREYLSPKIEETQARLIGFLNF